MYPLWKSNIVDKNADRMEVEMMEFDPTGMINLQYFQEIGDFSEYLDWYDWEVLRWHIFRVDYRRSYESFCKLFPDCKI